MNKREQLKAAVAKAEALAKKSADTPEAFTDEDMAQVKALTDEIQTLKADIAALDALQANVAEAKAGQGRLTQNAASAAGPAQLKSQSDLNFEQTGGFASLAEFAQSAMRGSAGAGHTPKLDEKMHAWNSYAATVTSQDGTGAGFLIPPQFGAEIKSLLLDEPNIISLMGPKPTNSNTVVTMVDDKTPWSTSGVRAYWVPENGQITESSPTLKQVTYKVNKLAALSVVTEEMLQDGPRINNLLTQQAADAIKWTAEEAILFGSGNGQPKGLFSGSAGGHYVEVAKETGQAAKTIVPLNVLKMLSQIAVTKGAFWLANSDTLPQLATMTIGNHPVWTAYDQGLKGDVQGNLLGRPIIFTEHADTVGDANDLMLVSPAGYDLSIRSDVTFASSIHLYFDYDKQAFRWTYRLGGTPLLETAFAKAKSSEKKAYAVNLAARA